MSLENLEEVHKRGGDCDKQRDNLWREIRAVEGKVTEERIEQIKLSTRIAIVTGLLCGLPGLILVALEIYRAIKG